MVSLPGRQWQGTSDDFYTATSITKNATKLVPAIQQSETRARHLVASKAHLKVLGEATVHKMLCQEGLVGLDDGMEGWQYTVHEHTVLQQGQTRGQAG